MTAETLEDGGSSAVPAHLLRSSTSTHRLNQIDKIRANGVGDHVSLPQLVVCGDQSAGKSSVLERVTGIPFPRQEGLCTRFPTEIILRHCNKPTRLSASIVPSTESSLEIQEVLRGYHRNLENIEELPGVINEAGALMGIRGHEQRGHGNSFSLHVLRIEKSGPTGLHLTIVDLPGLISVSNEDQTEEDVQMVAEMVEGYLSNTRTIIMAVLQASNDIANQRIVQLARRHDPGGRRTVGIITKPDLINQGTEDHIAKLAKNNDVVKMKLGFFLLKNPSPAEISAGLSAEDCSRREIAYFSQPSWRRHSLDMDRVGAEPLRLFLQELLDKHIEKELPQVRKEIEHQLADTEAELLKLGTERRTVDHIRSFMTALSMRFYQLAQSGLDGNYQGPDWQFFELPCSRLRAMIQAENGLFANQMHDHGKKREIRTGNIEKEEGTNAGDTEDVDLNTEAIGESEAQQLYVTEKEMTAWVMKVYMNTRGRELPGNYNHVLLAELFHEQSRPWASIAKQHLVTVLNMVSQWLEKVLEVSIQEEPVSQAVHTLCLSNFNEAEKRALEELDKLLADEKRQPITYNHYYTDNIQNGRRTAQERYIKQFLYNVRDDRGGKLPSINHDDDVAALVQAMRKQVTINMDEQACSEALDGLNAYYKVAMKTFVDNVCRQVIERHVLSGLPTFFCPNTVSKLDNEELERIGSEPENRRTKRAELQALAQGLRQSVVDLLSPTQC